MRAWERQTYGLLRIVTGFLFVWHGMQKLFGFPGSMPPGAPAFVIWIAGPIELVCGAVVMIAQVRMVTFTIVCSGDRSAAAHGPVEHGGPPNPG